MFEDRPADGFRAYFAASGAVVYRHFSAERKRTSFSRSRSTARARPTSGIPRTVPTSDNRRSGVSTYHPPPPPPGAAVPYSTFISGEGSEYAIQVALDSSGAAYIVGGTDSAQLTTFMALQPSLRGPSDAWLMKIGANRTLKYMASTLAVAAATVATAWRFRGARYSFGGIHAAQSDLPMAAPREALCSGGFVTKLAGDGTAVQRTANLEDSNGRAVAVDARGRAFLVGTPGPSFTTTPDAFPPSPGPGGSLGLAVMPLGGLDRPKWNTRPTQAQPDRSGQCQDRRRWRRLHWHAVRQRPGTGRLSRRQRAIRVCASQQRRDALRSRITAGVAAATRPIAALENSWLPSKIRTALSSPNPSGRP